MKEALHARATTAKHAQHARRAESNGLRLCQSKTCCHCRGLAPALMPDGNSGRLHPLCEDMCFETRTDLIFDPEGSASTKVDRPRESPRSDEITNLCTRVRNVLKDIRTPKSSFNALKTHSCRTIHSTSSSVNESDIVGSQIRLARHRRCTDHPPRRNSCGNIASIAINLSPVPKLLAGAYNLLLECMNFSKAKETCRRIQDLIVVRCASQAFEGCTTENREIVFKLEEFIFHRFMSSHIKYFVLHNQSY